MKISTAPSVSHIASKRRATEEEADSTSTHISDTFRTDTNSTLKSVARWAGPIAGLAAAGAAAYFTGTLPGLGLSGLIGGAVGAVAGGTVGAAAGLAAGKHYELTSEDDGLGKGLMGGIYAVGGGAVGALVGGISGALGANPLLTVPATLAAGAVALRATDLLAERAVGGFE